MDTSFDPPRSTGRDSWLLMTSSDDQTPGEGPGGVGFVAGTSNEDVQADGSFSSCSIQQMSLYWWIGAGLCWLQDVGTSLSI